MALASEYVFADADPDAETSGGASLLISGAAALPGGGHTGGGLITDQSRNAICPTTAASASYTVMSWVKLGGSGFSLNVFGNTLWAAYIDARPATPLLTVTDHGQTDDSVAATIPSDGAWHHIAVTFVDSVADTHVFLFVDGEYVDDWLFVASTPPDFVGGFGIGGADPNNTVGAGSITLDDFRVFNESITNQAVIQTWMNTPGEDAGPVDPATYAHLTNADLELAWLLGNGATGPSLSDARRQVYGGSDHAYFAGLSGLAPAAAYSLSDHQLAYFRAQTGTDDLPLSDTARIFWAS